MIDVSWKNSGCKEIGKTNIIIHPTNWDIWYVLFVNKVMVLI